MYTKDYSKLRGRIVEKYGTLTAFAKAVGTSKVLMSYKITGAKPITSRDIESWSELLDIPTREIGIYFFTRKV